MSRFLFGLYRDAGAIRVRRAATVTLGQAQEAHTRRVIDAWMAAAQPSAEVGLANVRAVPVRPVRVRVRLRAALVRRLAR